MFPFACQLPRIDIDGINGLKILGMQDFRILIDSSPYNH